MEVQSHAYCRWKKQCDHSQIAWTTLPPIENSLQTVDLTDCNRRCKSYRSGLQYRALCIALARGSNYKSRMYVVFDTSSLLYTGNDY